MPFWTHLLRLLLRKIHCMKALYRVKTFSSLFNHGSQMVFRNLTFSFLHKANLKQNAQNKFGFAPCFWTSSSPFGQALIQTPNSHPGTSRSLWCFQSEVLFRETVGERLFKKKKIDLSNHGSKMTDLFIHLQISQYKKPRKIQLGSSKAGYGH